MQYPYNAIINKEDYAVILEHSSRKYLRRVARKKYTREYRETREYIIISGESKKNAISLYESILAKREEAKLTQVAKSTKQVDKSTTKVDKSTKLTQVDKSTTKKEKKTTTKSTTNLEKSTTNLEKSTTNLESMLDDAIKQAKSTTKQQEAEHAKINKKTFSQLVKEKKYSEALSN